jgi:hypothetical protein
MTPVKIYSTVWVVLADNRGVVKGQVIPARRLRGGMYLVRSSRDKSLLIRPAACLHETRDGALQELKQCLIDDIQLLESAYPSQAARIKELKQKLKSLEGEQPKN